MRALAIVLFYVWAGALLLLGASGIFTGAWELNTIYGLDLMALGQERTSMLLNQYRFLKAMEFGFGVFCLVFKNEIFMVRKFNRVFLAVVFVGAGARALSMLLDGMPHWGFLAITAQEFATGVAVAAYTRRTRQLS